MEAEDERLIEETLDNLSARCNHSMVCERTFFTCSRYASHPGQCRTEDQSGTYFSWWGRNKAPYEGMQNSVWKTVDYTKHVLRRQEPLGIPGVPREIPRSAFDGEDAWNRFIADEAVKKSI